jgi:hypothetical protein
MVSEDRSDGSRFLVGERCHQLSDGRAEHLHHLVTRNGEVDGGGVLDFGLDNLWRF